MITLFHIRTEDSMFGTPPGEIENLRWSCATLVAHNQIVKAREFTALRGLLRMSECPHAGYPGILLHRML